MAHFTDAFDAKSILDRTAKRASRGFRHVKGVGHKVALRARDDLFAENDAGIQIFNANGVTSIPDNVGCCEIVSVGRDVLDLVPGDVVFIDFARMDQGFIVDGGGADAEIYVAPDHAITAWFRNGDVVPMPGYICTVRDDERFKVALTGTDRVEVPPMLLTDGIVSGRASDGSVAARTRYERIVSIGAPAVDSPVRPMHRVERELVDASFAFSIGYEPGHGVRLQQAVAAYRTWLQAPRVLDMNVGDLVAFCTDFPCPVRVRGEFRNIVEADRVLGVIDDQALYAEAVRAGDAGKLQLVG